MQQTSFNPKDLDIVEGDTVEWHNHDFTTHTATDDGGSWDTGDTGNGETRSITFNSPANYTYHCQYHSFVGMTGTLDVASSNQAPSVAITSPSEGAVVQGEVNANGTASDPDGTVTQVEVRIDAGAWQVAEGTTSWSFAWDTTTVANGTHSVAARSWDGEAFSQVAKRNVTVANPPNEPPTVAITRPSGGQVVEGMVRLEGTASDPEGKLERVEWRVDDGPWRNASGLADWSADWDSRGVADGSHRLEARSFDGALFSAVARVSVTVDNLKPDLVVEGIEVAAGITFQNVTAKVKNQGDDRAGSFQVGFLYEVEGTLKRIGNQSIAGLAVGQSASVSVNWDVLGKLGNFTLHARADEANQVREHDEGNNAASRFTCVPPLLGLTCLLPGRELL